MKSPWYWGLWGWLVLACTDVADDRSRADETVGHYLDGGTRLDVDGGVAVIREVQPGRIVIWSNAPNWTATLALTTLEPLSIEVRNVIPESMLVAVGPNGEAIAVRRLDEATPTRYRFAIDAPLSAMQLELHSPEGLIPSAFRFAVLSDIQSAIVDISDVYRRMAAQADLAFVVSAGDLTQQGTAEQLGRFEAELESLPIPFYATLGNHELGTTPPPFQSLFGRATSHFHYRGAAFSLVDSASATLARRSLEWLEDWLAEDVNRVHVFVTHYPPIDPVGVRNGSFASRAEAHLLIARLAEGRVDLSLHGHVHSYYAFEMAGIPAYISGGGGAIPERFDGIGRHFLLVDVGSSAIEAVQVVRVD